MKKRKKKENQQSEVMGKMNIYGPTFKCEVREAFPRWPV
jgi:hypothetical protein